MAASRTVGEVNGNSTDRWRSQLGIDETLEAAARVAMICRGHEAETHRARLAIPVVSSHPKLAS